MTWTIDDKLAFDEAEAVGDVVFGVENPVLDMEIQAAIEERDFMEQEGLV